MDSNWLTRSDFVKSGFVLEDIDLFDAGLFNISPREAEITDPQHRLFLECAYEALKIQDMLLKLELTGLGYLPGRVRVVICGISYLILRLFQLMTL